MKFYFDKSMLKGLVWYFTLKALF